MELHQINLRPLTGEMQEIRWLEVAPSPRPSPARGEGDVAGAWECVILYSLGGEGGVAGAWGCVSPSSLGGEGELPAPGSV